MRSLYIIPILTSLYIYVSCSEKQTPGTPGREHSEKRLLEDKSGKYIIERLTRMKRLLSETSEKSCFSFSGNQEKLDEALKAFSELYTQDQYLITWIPEPTTNGKDLEGVIKIEPSPEYIQLFNDLIQVYELELNYRKKSQ